MAVEDASAIKLDRSERSILREREMDEERKN